MKPFLFLGLLSLISLIPIAQGDCGNLLNPQTETASIKPAFTYEFVPKDSWGKGETSTLFYHAETPLDISHLSTRLREAFFGEAKIQLLWNPTTKVGALFSKEGEPHSHLEEILKIAARRSGQEVEVFAGSRFKIEIRSQSTGPSGLMFQISHIGSTYLFQKYGINGDTGPRVLVEHFDLKITYQGHRLF